MNGGSHGPGRHVFPAPGKPRRRRRRQCADQGGRQGDGRRAGAHRGGQALDRYRAARLRPLSFHAQRRRHDLGRGRRAPPADPGLCDGRRRHGVHAQQRIDRTGRRGEGDRAAAAGHPFAEGLQRRALGDRARQGARESIAAGPQDAALFRRQGSRALRARPRHDRGLRQGHADRDAHASRTRRACSWCSTAPSSSPSTARKRW